MNRPTRVLLLAPPWGELYGRYRSFTRGYNLSPPLGLACIAAGLKAAGHQPHIEDLELLPRTRELLIGMVQCHRPDLVGISIASPQVPVVARMAEVVRGSLGLPVVIGGPHATVDPKGALQQIPHADAAIVGEADEVLPQALEAGPDPAEWTIPWVFTRNRGDEKDIRPALVESLDDLPSPDYCEIDSRKYLWNVRGVGMVPSLSLAASRGCPYDCSFCCSPLLSGGRVRFHDPTRTADDVARLVRDTHARHIVFVDDVLTLDRGRIVRLCDLLRSRRLPITWEGDTRADRVDRELLQLMARAGCVRINFGIESGDPGILAATCKGIDLDNVRQAFEWAKAAGMETRGSAMIGLPGDTRESIGRTIHFLAGLRNLDQPYLNIAMPYPGTKLRLMALNSEGGLSLVRESLGAQQRWGSAVLQVNGISPEEMVHIQRRSLARLYARPHRILYNLTRSRLTIGLRDAVGFLFNVVLGVRGRGAGKPYA